MWMLKFLDDWGGEQFGFMLQAVALNDPVTFGRYQESRSRSKWTQVELLGIDLHESYCWYYEILGTLGFFNLWMWWRISGKFVIDGTGGYL